MRWRFQAQDFPYSFQGHGEEGLKGIRKTADKHGLLVVSEVMESGQILVAEKYVDILQIGARNMQNYGLLRDVGRSRKPYYCNAA